jgi:hypothetical protein
MRRPGAWILATALALAVGGPAGGAVPAWAADGAPDDAATRRALNERAIEVLNQIRRSYPVDFGEEPAIHKAVRAHLAAGGDPADLRHLVKDAVIQGCRAACMRAVFEGFTRLDEAGVPEAEIQTLLRDAMHAARRAMPRQYTYQMLADRVTARVDRRLGLTQAASP